MIDKIQFKRFIVEDAKPTTAQVAEGELVLNLADKQIYTQDHLGEIIAVGGGSGGGGMPTFQVLAEDTNVLIGSGYLFDLSTKDVNVTFPAKATVAAGDWLAVGSYGKAVHKLILKSDANIMGSADDLEVQSDYAVLYFSYVDEGIGWKIVQAVGESEAPNAINTEITVNAKKGDRKFNIVYDLGFLHVYVNGEKLSTANFSAVNGTSFTLTEALQVDSVVNAVAYNHITVQQVTANMVTTEAGITVEEALKSVVPDSKVNYGVGTWSEIINKIPYIGVAGVMEVGKYIDFHDTNSTADLDCRLQVEGSNLIVDGKRLFSYQGITGRNSNANTWSTAGIMTEAVDGNSPRVAFHKSGAFAGKLEMYNHNVFAFRSQDEVTLVACEVGNPINDSCAASVGWVKQHGGGSSVYAGTDPNYKEFPIGTTIVAGVGNGGSDRNSQSRVYLSTGNGLYGTDFWGGSKGDYISGTWAVRGISVGIGDVRHRLMQRVL